MLSSIEIIGEIGINHNGSLDEGKRLIDAIGAAGFTAVKFQTYHPDKRFDPGNPFIDIFRKNWLPHEEEFKLWDFAISRGLRVYTSPFDTDTVNTIPQEKLTGLKIASFETTNLKLVEAVASKNLKTLVSLGQTSLKEFSNLLEVFGSQGSSGNVVPLHCISAYPTGETDIQLGSLMRLRNLWSGAIGFSDHTESNLSAQLALAIGASYFEKHVTLDKSLEGPDHRFSADPSEMTSYASAIRHAAEMIGSDSLGVRPVENFIFENARRVSN